MTPEQLRVAFDQRAGEAARAWLDAAIDDIRSDPTAVRRRFPAAGRHVGRSPLPTPDSATWTADDVARALLLLAGSATISDEVRDLHRFGDADEQRAIVRILHLLPPLEGARELVLHAARSNDPRLIRAALSPFGLSELDDDEIAQVALKCVFNGIPLTTIPGLGERRSAQLSRMLAGYALERIAAGRTVPADIWPFIDAYPPTDLLEAIERERRHPVEQRRKAAEAALAARQESS